MESSTRESILSALKLNQHSPIIFFALSLFYFAWMTGFTFEFSETKSFPNYNMLAKSFLKGKLSLDEDPPVDYLLIGQKKYIYFGPVPALFHIPSLLLNDIETPTGLMIILYLAGSCIVFHRILHSISQFGKELEPYRGYENLFMILFALNGYSLLMATIPSIHHEAICAGMFFLLIGIYYVIKAIKNNYQLTIFELVVAGVAFSLSIGSRFSYVFTVGFLILLLMTGVFFQSKRSQILLIFQRLWPVMFIPAITVCLLLLYNYFRFQSFFDFGVDYMATLFWKYFKDGNYFRYDHIPFNIWDYFFRAPELLDNFPFLKLPYNIVRIVPKGSTSYILIHCNELAASIFLFIPVLIFSATPLFTNASNRGILLKPLLFFLWIAFILQVLPLSLTVGSIARYYYDFLPFLLLLSFVGMFWIKNKLLKVLIPVLTVLSIVLSFAVVVNAMHTYTVTIHYQAPLLKFFQ